MSIDAKGISYPGFFWVPAGKRIGDFAAANAVFSSREPHTTAHVHKDCDLALRRASDGRYNNWHQLDQDLVYLMRRYGYVDHHGALTARDVGAAYAPRRNTRHAAGDICPV
jgi:hypothetical protein